MGGLEISGKWIFLTLCHLNFKSAHDLDEKVLRYVEEYDSTIPDVTLAQFLIERMKLFGNDVAIVSISF